MKKYIVDYLTLLNSEFSVVDLVKLIDKIIKYENIFSYLYNVMQNGDFWYIFSQLPIQVR